jgi:hypothetical protein
MGAGEAMPSSQNYTVVTFVWILLGKKRFNTFTLLYCIGSCPYNDQLIVTMIITVPCYKLCMHIDLLLP